MCWEVEQSWKGRQMPSLKLSHLSSGLLLQRSPHSSLVLSIPAPCSHGQSPLTALLSSLKSFNGPLTRAAGVNLDLGTPTPSVLSKPWAGQANCFCKGPKVSIGGLEGHHAVSITNYSTLPCWTSVAVGPHEAAHPCR